MGYLPVVIDERGESGSTHSSVAGGLAKAGKARRFSTLRRNAEAVWRVFTIIGLSLPSSSKVARRRARFWPGFGKRCARVTRRWDGKRRAPTPPGSTCSPSTSSPAGWWRKRAAGGSTRMGMRKFFGALSWAKHAKNIKTQFPRLSLQSAGGSRSPRRRPGAQASSARAFSLEDFNQTSSSTKSSRACCCSGC